MNLLCVFSDRRRGRFNHIIKNPAKPPLVRRRRRERKIIRKRVRRSLYLCSYSWLYIVPNFQGRLFTTEKFHVLVIGGTDVNYSTLVRKPDMLEMHF